MTQPPRGQPPDGPRRRPRPSPLGPPGPQPYDTEQTVVLTPAQLAEYARAVERERAVRGYREGQPPPPRHGPPEEPTRPEPPLADEATQQFASPFTAPRSRQAPPPPPPPSGPPPPHRSRPRPRPPAAPDDPYSPATGDYYPPEAGYPPVHREPRPGADPSGVRYWPATGEYYRPGAAQPYPPGYRPPAPSRGGPVPPPGGARHGQAAAASEASIGRSSRIMIIATAGSRLTGFLRSLAIAAAVGLGLVSDAYNTANTLPNIVYELLLGGVLTSVIIPLLVHAQQDDADGGEAYTQRLLTLSTLVLGVATVLAMLAAPLLTTLYVGNGSPKAHLTTLWALLLLPEILFYGIGALFGAILNTRGVFGAPMWAPILNNVVVVATAGVFLALPGPKNLDPNTITTTQVLVLGVGTTVGIVAQAAVLVPYLRRVGFRWKFRLDVRNSRLGEAGSLAMWVVGYSVVSAVGYLVQTRIANGVSLPGHSYATFASASLLFQMPYGILGVSLLTALMPRMSRAAARGDTAGVIRDLSLGSRLSAAALLPVTALLIVLGPTLGTVVFSLGRAGDHGPDVGAVLALSAFGLVPFAVTMLQLRVFYAVKDARTPTLLNVGTVVAKVALSLPLPFLLSDTQLVGGLAVVNSLSFVVGALLGEAALRRRFGSLDTAAIVGVLAKLCVAGGVAVVVGFGVRAVLDDGLGTGVAGSSVTLVLCSAVMCAVFVAAAVALRIGEISEIVGTVRRRATRAQ